MPWVRPLTYRDPMRFETMPSRSMAQAYRSAATVTGDRFADLDAVAHRLGFARRCGFWLRLLALPEARAHDQDRLHLSLAGSRGQFERCWAHDARGGLGVRKDSAHRC